MEQLEKEGYEISEIPYFEIEAKDRKDAAERYRTGTLNRRGAKKMNTFDDCIENRLQKIRKTLLLKAKEYASNDNRFHNFDVAAHILNSTPERALQGMMLKHIVSIFDLIEWTEVNEQLITESLINEKIGDAINYLILLEGLLLRRINMKEKEGETEQ